MTSLWENALNSTHAQRQKSVQTIRDNDESFVLRDSWLLLTDTKIKHVHTLLYVILFILSVSKGEPDEKPNMHSYYVRRQSSVDVPWCFTRIFIRARNEWLTMDSYFFPKHILITCSKNPHFICDSKTDSAQLFTCLYLWCLFYDCWQSELFVSIYRPLRVSFCMLVNN